MELSEIIKKRIHDSGPISFHDFMEMALYYPELGYYTSSTNKLGINGDYYTSPYLTNLFGRMLGKQIEEMWFILDKQPFSIIEYGGGNGNLCTDILVSLKNNPPLYDQLTYYIIEKSPLIKQAAKKLSDKVIIVDSAKDIPITSGCVLSNELIDNFPIHNVVMENELKEVFVTTENGKFIEILKPAAESLKNYFKKLGIKLPKGFRTEVNLDIMEWMNEISSILKRGFVLTVDYGYRSLELYNITRKEGTLICYHKHTTNQCPYENIGQQDITAHVNFSALAQIGQEKGFENCGYSTQTDFLLSLGLVNHLKEIETKEKDLSVIESNIAMLYTLLMDIGKKFKVLIQKKDINVSFLSGMRFSQQLT
ncbi:MAG: SAM-dependent methyltransferase [Bacteroidota bacterium]